jgi:hypothetical protein
MGRHHAEERGSRVAKADGSDAYDGKHRHEDRASTSGASTSERSSWTAGGRDTDQPTGWVGRDD